MTDGEIEGSHDGATLSVGYAGVNTLVLDDFVTHLEAHDIYLPTRSGGHEYASWSFGAGGSRISYRAFSQNGRATIGGNGEGATATFRWVLRVDAFNAGGVRAILGRAIEDGTGVRLDLVPLRGGAFVGVAQVGGSGLANSQRATGSFSIAAAGTVTPRP